MTAEMHGKLIFMQSLHRKDILRVDRKEKVCYNVCTENRM